MNKSTQSAAEKISGKPHGISKEEAMILEALTLQEEVTSRNERLKAIKEHFLTKFESDRTEERVITASGAAILKTTNSYSVETTMLEKLRKLFGSEFKEFVSEKVSYGVTAKLKQLLNKGDFKGIKTIRDAVMITTNYSVAFEPPTKLVKGGKK